MEPLTQADPETKSVDVLAENVERLSELFPEVVADGAVDFEALRQLLGDAIDDSEERFGLNWHGKRRARQLSLTPSTGTLRPCPEESVDWDTTQNLMIEGDNLEVLKLLQKSYAGKVKLIYIDPPYNTGKDFVYPDNFKDSIGNYLALTRQADDEGMKLTSNTEASGRFHTDWLNMMYPRLKLARSLLRDDGVLVVSIDDHELANLLLITNLILGEENFIACCVWEKGRKNDAKLVSVGHEYLLVYARDLAHIRSMGTRWREEKPGARDIWGEYVRLRSVHGDDHAQVAKAIQAWFKSLPASHPSRKWARYKHVDEHGPWRDDNISWPGGGGPRYDVIHPVTGEACAVPERGWIFATPDEMARRIALGQVEFREDHTQPPYRKSHLRPLASELSESDALINGDEDVDDALATQVRGSYFYKQAQVEVKAMRALMGAKVFDNPKDRYELARWFDYLTSSDEDAVILDFFAGSGTAGHSTLMLNAEDGGRRRYILVQLPEPLDPANKEQKLAAEYCDELGIPRTIAELTKERLRRAGAKVAADYPDHNGDLGFRVFKLDSSNIRAWDPHPTDLDATLEQASEHLKADRSEQDILYEVLLKLGLDLCVPIQTTSISGLDVHAIGGGVLLACLSEKIADDGLEDLATGIASWVTELQPIGDTTCVFRDSAFTDDVAKTNLTTTLAQNSIATVRSI